MTTTPESITWDWAEGHNTTARGTRVYWAVTWLDSETPNGRYEIEKLSPTMWVATHSQVIRRGGEKVVRRVSGLAARTRAEAVAQVEADAKDFAANVLHAIIHQPRIEA